MTLRFALALLVALAPGCAAPKAASGPRRPNLVFIMADDLGTGHLGSYGQRAIRTPNLDRMAREGTRYTQVYAGSSVCAPSRSVLMSGLHGGHASVRVNGGGTALLPSDVTVAELLKAAGYATGIFGKWGLGDEGTDGQPTRQGFDEFFGYLNQVHAHFHYPHYLFQNEARHPIPENEGEARRVFAQDAIVEEALGFVRRHRDRPFFLYLPLTIPHFELLVPEDSAAEYRGRFPEPQPYADARKHYADQPAPRATFAAMVTRLDRDVGRLLDLLRELGLDGDTLVFFTSDNGGYLLDRENFFGANGGLRGAKGLLYEGGIRVPMIARWPGRVAAGATDDFVWTFWDVLPTLTELAGAETPSGLDGVSVAPRLLGRPQPAPERFLYWEMVGPDGGTGPPRTQAARKGTWKAHRARARGPLELYDLAKDPGEAADVAAGNPALVADFEAYFKTARTPARPTDPGPPTWGWERTRTGYVK